MPVDITSHDDVLGATIGGESCSSASKVGMIAGGQNGVAHVLTTDGGCVLLLHIGPDDWPTLAASVKAQLDGLLSVLSSHMRAAHCDDALAAAVVDYYGGE